VTLILKAIYKGVLPDALSLPVHTKTSKAPLPCIYIEEFISQNVRCRNNGKTPANLGAKHLAFFRKRLVARVWKHRVRAGIATSSYTMLDADGGSFVRRETTLRLKKVLACMVVLVNAPGSFLGGAEQSRSEWNTTLRTRHSQSLAQPFSPHAADVLESFDNTGTSSLCFSLFEFSVPVASLDVGSAFLGLFVLSLPFV
jgi:hypothetical protein